MLIIGFLPWYLDVIFIRVIHALFPAYTSTVRRMIALLLKSFPVMLLSAFLVVYVQAWVLPGVYVPDAQKFWWCVVIGYGITFIATMVWEGDFIIKQWKDSLKEQELYAQLALQNEFDALKSQVNPHFLFNCFNTLSSLITEDKLQAEKFLNELSKVYRYLLRSNEDGMSTLENEIGFIQSYYKLLKTRYSDAVKLDMNVSAQYNYCVLPSLSLQMLVENAVKHNALSKSQPVNIHISTAEGKLVVRNNVQPLMQKAPSGNIGLKNIKAKYELLKLEGFSVASDAAFFTVELPLLCDKPLLNTQSEL
jgi:LytS/YehU family sensor histidine kinase